MNYKLEEFPTTDLSDAHPDKVQQLLLPLLNFGKRKRFAGRIRTFVTMEDTKKIQETLFSMQGDGGVIVLDGGGSLRNAMLGDRMAARLLENDWAGIIVNGVIRDSKVLSGIDLGIKALGTTPVRGRKTGIGAIDVPVAFGNVYIEPGMCLYADEDGVLISNEPLAL